MESPQQSWKKGRGRLGLFRPLLGRWSATAESPMGTVRCTREFGPALGGKFVRLEACWKFGDRDYEEVAFFGPGPDGTLGFWSFTSDGKHSEGKLVEAPDLHPQAIAFEAQMPAGLARQAYWPDEREGFHWVVESRNKKGWNRFVHHHYLPA